MTIRLTTSPRIYPTPDGRWVVHAHSGGPSQVAGADTEAEAEQARRAFELVLAPRFTRDEAIAKCAGTFAEFGPRRFDGEHSSNMTERAIKERGWAIGFAAGMRAALEALAAAGVFSDGRNMADRLDAAGIR